MLLLLLLVVVGMPHAPGNDNAEDEDEDEEDEDDGPTTKRASSSPHFCSTSHRCKEHAADMPWRVTSAVQAGI